MVQNRIVGTMLVIFFMGTAVAQALEWNPRMPLNYPSSLHSKILSGDTANMRELYTEYCLASVRAHLKAGGNFYSKTAVKYSAPFEKNPRADVADNTFFHWTNANTAFDKIIRQRSYEDLFSYVRSRGSDAYDWLIYLAADPSSSESYGRFLYKFTMKKGSRIFFLRGDYQPGYYIPEDRLNSMIVKEVSEKNPALQACDIRGIPDAPTLLTALVMEASDISLIAYIGADNKFGSSRGYQWLQLVNPWAIESMELYQTR